jgi:hypothetical protein
MGIIEPVKPFECPKCGKQYEEMDISLDTVKCECGEEFEPPQGISFGTFLSTIGVLMGSLLVFIVVAVVLFFLGVSPLVIAGAGVGLASTFWAGMTDWRIKNKKV